MDKQELRKAWVEALKSGQYNKGKLSLHEIYGGRECFCVWGVACEVYNKLSKDPVTVQETDEGGDNVVFWYDGSDATPPEKVTEAYGFGCTDTDSLVHMNDQTDATFEELATIIENSWITGDDGSVTLKEGAPWKIGQTNSTT